MDNRLKIYRLQAGRRDPSGQVAKPTLFVTFPADSDKAAIMAARHHPVNFFADTGDYAWLTDDEEKVIWSLKLEEA